MSINSRFQVSDLVLTESTKEQNKEIDALTHVKDFLPANYDKATRTLSFTGFDEEEPITRFFKKLVKIVPIFGEVTIEDSEEDTYWLLKLSGVEIKEHFGVPFWGTSVDKQRIKSVLTAHIEASEEKFNEMVEQIVMAIKGYYEDETTRDIVVEDDEDIKV